MSVSSDDVKKLAELSRLELSDAEVEKLRQDIASIMAYVEAVRAVPLPDGVAPSPHLELQNVMREDADPHDAGMYTATALAQAPEREGDYFKVKKILG